MSGLSKADLAAWAEAMEDVLCVCGHAGWLHDDGLDACAGGPGGEDEACTCPKMRPAYHRNSKETSK